MSYTCLTIISRLCKCWEWPTNRAYVRSLRNGVNAQCSRNQAVALRHEAGDALSTGTNAGVKSQVSGRTGSFMHYRGRHRRPSCDPIHRAMRDPHCGPHHQPPMPPAASSRPSVRQAPQAAMRGRHVWRPRWSVSPGAVPCLSCLQRCGSPFCQLAEGGNPLASDQTLVTKAPIRRRDFRPTTQDLQRARLRSPQVGQPASHPAA